MSPPPSWKIFLQSRSTHTHCDSHTGLIMSHAYEISEAPPSMSFGMGDVPLSVYGTMKETDPFEVGMSYNARS